MILFSLSKVILLVIITVILVVSSSKLEDRHLDDLLLKTQSGKGIFVTMKNGTGELLNNLISSRLFNSREERINAIVETLKSHAKLTQESIQKFLLKETIYFQSFWISNQIYIPRPNFPLLSRLSLREDIGKITQEDFASIDEPQFSGQNLLQDDESVRDTQWGISKIEADRVWEQLGTTGRGVVMGIIDTGARATHQDLRHNHRTPYGWFDPAFLSSTPQDIHGHGTHCLGIMAGANGIGVAPGGQWIACKGCQTGSCLYSDLIMCGQWMLCPTLVDGTTEDCTKAPHLVSNSWAAGQGNTFYDLVINAWNAAGIIPIFGQANAGNLCGTTLSPADYENVIGVGSTNENDDLSFFSSRGPSYFGSIKPDVSAPGERIYSSYFRADNSYEVMTGTSMATPHVAGAVALILSIDINLSLDQVKSILARGSETTGLNHCNQVCGGINGTTYPNNCFGHGRLSAYNSISSIMIHKNVKK